MQAGTASPGSRLEMIKGKWHEKPEKYKSHLHPLIKEDKELERQQQQQQRRQPAARRDSDGGPPDGRRTSAPQAAGKFRPGWFGGAGS